MILQEKQENIQFKYLRYKKKKAIKLEERLPQTKNKNNYQINYIKKMFRFNGLNLKQKNKINKNNKKEKKLKVKKSKKLKSKDNKNGKQIKFIKINKEVYQKR